jgi:hypothetical protein
MLALSEFYRHASMADGHLNICKACVKERMQTYRARNIDRIRAYDRSRADLPDRIEHRKNAPRPSLSINRQYQRKYQVKYPERHSARMVARSAVRRGDLRVPDLCEACHQRRRLHGHHDDYSKALDVRWLCDPCHKAHHKAEREAARQSSEEKEAA